MKGKPNACESDFLVIGSGIAGLFFALKAAQYGSVVIITKKRNFESSSNHAQGGIAAVLAQNDSPALHVEDTLKAGDGLCKKAVVETVVTEGPYLIQELMDLGVHFSRKWNSRGKLELDLGTEGGHSRKRIAHVQDFTGEKLERTLIQNIKRNRKIRLLENHSAIELITEHHIPQLRQTPLHKRHCWGAYVLDTKNNKIKTFLSRITLLATGGVGQVYQHTTNPPIATGDGMAMAYRAGAQVANLEFMQFHPTAFYTPEEPGSRFLISEAVRGFGGILKTKDGKTFMERYHPDKSLATRDIVARAIDNEMKMRGDAYVLLDITYLPARKVRERFPNIYKHCLKHNVDITKQPIPVTPAAHYMCGGVCTDLLGRTTIRNLYACGEVAQTGLHGANRLASNSLLEAVVFAKRAFFSAAQQLQLTREKIPLVPRWDDKGTRSSKEWVLISHNKREIREIMWDYVGIVRSRQRLQRAQKRLELIAQEVREYYQKTRITNELLELRNMVTMARLIIQCALWRKESRGLHFITDFPKRNDRSWKKDTIIRKKRHAE